MSPYKHIIVSKSLGFSLCLNMLQYFYPQELSNYKVGIFPFVWLLGSEAAQLRKSRKSHISAYSDLFLTLCICSTLPTPHFWFYWIQFCIILPFHLFTYLVQRNVCFVFFKFSLLPIHNHSITHPKSAMKLLVGRVLPLEHLLLGKL